MVDRNKDVVIIPNTSGSTGMPKGAMHTHHNMIANNASMRYAFSRHLCVLLSCLSNIVAQFDNHKPFS